MRLLLDIHTFLWFALDDPQLSATAINLISNPNNEIEISAVSYWEIAIKISIGNYILSESLEDFIEREVARRLVRDRTFQISALRFRSSATNFFKPCRSN